MRLKTLNTDALRKAVGTVCHGKAGLAEGTNANTIQIANAIDFTINGYFYSKAATDNIAISAAQQADLTTCMYLITIDSSGAVTATKGTEQVTGNGEKVELPEPPDDEAVIGAIKVVTNGATFTAGSTDLGAAGITDTYYDLSHAVDDDFA